MKKTMYSLMLAEDVIREIDRLAAEKSTNRSNLVNQILAEYVSMATPEKHVQNIFDIIERFIGQQSGYLLYSQPNDMTMSIKSSLQYHYRPTIRYEVEMYRSPDKTLGQLKIIFRTTSSELLLELTRFFKIWIQLENIYIKNFFEKGAIEYGMENGRFCAHLLYRTTRTIPKNRSAMQSATILPPLTKCSKTISPAATRAHRISKRDTCSISTAACNLYNKEVNTP